MNQTQVRALDVEKNLPPMPTTTDSGKYFWCESEKRRPILIVQSLCYCSAGIPCGFATLKHISKDVGKMPK